MTIVVTTNLVLNYILTLIYNCFIFLVFPQGLQDSLSYSIPLCSMQAQCYFVLGSKYATP